MRALTAKKVNTHTEAALSYAEKGFKVFPLHWIENGKCSCDKKCTSPGKHPLTKNGLKDATDDRKQIAKWFDNTPQANIGIRTGKESGIFVIDLDIKPGIDGLKAFDAIIKKHGKLPKTAGQKTGSGGVHFIFRYPDFEVRNSTDLIVDGVKQKGIDIRGQEGYIVGAPSNHKSGGVYEFTDNPIADAPEWLLTILKTSDRQNTPTTPVQAPKMAPKTLTAEETDAISDALKEEWGMDMPESATSHRPLIEGISILFKRNGIPREDAEGFLTEFNQTHPCSDGNIHDPKDIQRYVYDCYNRDYKVSRDIPKSLIAAILKAFEDRNRIEVIISKADNLKGRIYNGEDGRLCIVRETKVYDSHRNEVMENGKPKMQEKETVLFHFKGFIREPVLFNGKPAISMEFNGEESLLSENEAITAIKQRFSLAQSKVQDIREIFDAWVAERGKSGNMVEIPLSPIFLRDGVVKCEPKESHDTKAILTALSDEEDKASSPQGFRVALGFNLIAPLFSEIKERSGFLTQTPYLMFSGLSHTGKTPLIEIFCGFGYSQSPQNYYFGVERVKTAFMMAKHLQQDNLPKNIDEINEKWLLSHVDELKNYSQTRYFSDRGRGDQSHNEYLGLSGLNFSTNSNIRTDGDLGISNRFVHVRFGHQELGRVNKAEFLKFRDALPNGFMFDIFKEVFDGKSIEDVIKDVGKFEYGHEWVNYSLNLLNELCRKYGIKEFAKYDPIEDHIETNAMEFAIELIAEHSRIENSKRPFTGDDGDTIQYTRPTLGINGAFKIEEMNNRTHIFFTAGAFKKISNIMRFPYGSVSDFINNIRSSDKGVRVENEGKSKGKKIDGQTVYVYEISIPNPKEGI